MEQTFEVNKELKKEMEGISVRISEDSMRALIMMEQPQGTEKRTVEELQVALKEAGVTRGINQEILQKMVNEGMYYRECVVANGRPVVDGADGYYTFGFRTEMLSKPVVLPDGSIDYKNVELFERVQKGQLVAEYTSATVGSFGYTVTGQLLIPKKGKELPVLRGKGFSLSEDKKKYTSLMEGRIEYKDGHLEISSFFSVAGDLDMTIGNIRFGGDVEILGDVAPNMIIEALGNIVVGGHVSAAQITAGGDILLKEGMQGSGKGKIVAGGNINGKFFENAEIECKGNVGANYLLNCSLHAEGCVTISGQQGAIIGGLTRAVRGIQAMTLGNKAEVFTVLDIGVNREMTSRYTELKKLLSKIDSELKIFSEGKDKLALAANISQKNQMMYQKVQQALIMKEEEKQKYLQEYRKLTETINGIKNIEIVVTGFAYPGVKIIIDMEDLTLQSKYKNVHFRRREETVLVFPNS